MTQEIEGHKGFRRWFEAGFGGETLPIIPPDATITRGSDVKDRHRGKTPGVLTGDGTWSGLGGRWAEERVTTIADAKKYILWGASVGLQSRTFLGLDIDVEDEAMALACEELALEHFGFAPVRSRAGSPRRLLVFKRPKYHDPIRKVRVAWNDAVRTDAAGAPVKHAVELLGHGQQYVVEGPHPKGGAYEWRHGESPCEFGTDGLTEIDADVVEKFFATLRDMVPAKGWGEITRGAIATGSVPSTRKKLDNEALWAKSPALVLQALEAWPNNPDNLPSHDDFVTALAAIKAALGPKREDYYSDVLGWALHHDGIRPEYVKKTWDSITDASLGAAWLFQNAKTSGEFTAEAQEDFDEAGDALIGETPLERMLKRYVWVQQLERYIELDTGSALSARALNAANVQIAAFGNTGVKSAEATFQNARGARKAQIATYRPGRPVLIDDENQSGVRVRAVNLWRPSAVVPIEGVSDDMVRPWLDHVALIFGEPGDPAREHFLDFFGFTIQNPGVKINHAPVILGEQGVGKDTAFAPIFDAIGQHNVSQVKPEMLAGQFTQFLQAQVISVSEMMNFTKREVYNRLKDWIAAPPLFVEVNKKNQQPYAIPNTQIWVFFTNYDDAIALDEDDRRFWVHRAYLEEPREPAYYASLYNWLNHEQGAAKVAGWLKQRDVSQFNPAARPPMTAAKMEMVANATPAGTRWLCDQLATGGAFHGRELVAAKDLIDHARTAFDSPQGVIREKHATAALRRAGYKAIDMKVRRGDGAVVRLWTNSERPALLTQLGHARLLERYEAEEKKGAARRQGA